MSQKKKILLATGALILAGVAGSTIYSWLTTARVTVSTSPGATIFIKEGAGSFIEAGKGRVVVKTKSLAAMYIEAREGEAVTQKAIQPQPRVNLEVSLTLKNPGKALAVAPGPFINPFIEGGFIYGINPNTNALDTKSLTGDNSRLPKLPLLPFLRQIIWENSRSFIYVTASKGAGRISPLPGASSQDLPYTAVAKVNSSSTALVSRRGLHLARSQDLNSAPILTTYPADTIPFVFADNLYLYFGWQEFGATDNKRDNELFSLTPEHEEEDSSITATQLITFDHSGKEIKRTKLSVPEPVFRVTAIDQSSIAVLMGDGMRVITVRGNEVEKVNFSFGHVKDLVLYNKRLLLLGSAGLWEYSRNDAAFYKVASYPSGEEYVADSLAVFTNDLYFSTQATREELQKTSNQTRSTVYKIAL